MKTSDLFFDLPQELIAQEPPPERGTSRLFLADRAGGTAEHRVMADIVEAVAPGTVMIFNDSRVRRARVYARTVDTGSSQEFLLIEPRDPNRWLVIGPNTKKQRLGRVFRFDPSGITARVSSVEPPYRELTFSEPVTDQWLDEHGHIPLPPYIARTDSPDDAQRYQTVYARAVGSVAAPTAGLHFTKEILQALQDRGVEIHFVTLHVGIGTFLPVRTEVLEDHQMHTERYSVSPETARAIGRAKEEGRPVLAVGTTAVRTLESAWDESLQRLVPGENDTGIFIYPGYRFRVVDQLFTNFHTPGSTLLALVSAFATPDDIRRWYRLAVEERYRFFSYGDAMLIR
ncbi:S-adenosylmethionine:tRNA ribosyltransferase-isomerase [Alkalispirochaeta sphaeroplastigenens]|uniref:S-adenosylmethionine:tRNA ribosyltransferase-isomerase n=1 Tax=Alkalispirochaeta sphaeroplastigenens TaxID=1187066 RepID=A0A2S4JFA8_9SPIO|nr:tRNA preQ1(34) S-adenosylmethionine ribosyltransferase-isomerase QueA [Alkalispirochaeta sphaeroplastigenens]POQ98247.1 S-adenosylmethionine:tRNA ribosyltransferase-isomerase [Alkalispirochaeta sphaeroplastigenens]